MLEIALVVRADDSEQLLDALLPLAPLGVHVLARGDETELRIRVPAARMPDRDQIAAAAGAYAETLSETEISDDWRELAVRDYQPRLIAGRFVVRREWAPPPDGDVIDIVLSDRIGFGDGSHATTTMCLEELARLEVRGSLADLGSGTGVLAIAAARLGFTPVSAVDYKPETVAAISANAALSGVSITTEVIDLMTQPPPPADVVVANIGFDVHRAIAASLVKLPKALILSGITNDQADEVVATYADVTELTEVTRKSASGWAAVVLASPQRTG